mgnify:CR=1 FL=1
MCTAATYKTKDFYFGRTLDYEFSYGETVTVTPRNFRLEFRHMGVMERHFAFIGMAHVADNYPLYYDAVNEKGLGIAGLNFVGNAVYQPAAQALDNIAQFELIPWLLGQCATLAQARALLERMNLLNEPFHPSLPLAQLHWLIADEREAVTVESTADGLHVYENPIGVLTNNPPFGEQLFNLNNYMHLSPRQPENRFSQALPLRPYSRGMGALGLPGDLSSMSRFVRAAFTKLNAVSDDTEQGSVSQFFHILGAVEQQRGCCEVADGQYERTIYTSCCNAHSGVYYYSTYDNRCLTAVDLHRENLDGSALIAYPLITEQHLWKNRRKNAKAGERTALCVLPLIYALWQCADQPKEASSISLISPVQSSTDANQLIISSYWSSVRSSRVLRMSL